MSYLDIKHTYPSSVALVVDANNNPADLSIVAAVTGKRIVVDFAYVHASAALTAAFFESGTATKIFQLGGLIANTGIPLPEPGFATAAGEALTFTGTITGTISIFVRYHLEG